MAETPVNTVVAVQTKSVGIALILSILFGPLGMLYSTIPGAVVMFIINVIALIATAGLGLFVTWPICAIWAAVAANNKNKQLLAGRLR